jgi:CRP-like cAMP-binding protein
MSRYEPGEPIQRRNDTHAGWWGVASGRVEIRLLSASGSRYVSQVLRSGDWFGEDLREPPGPSPYDAVAVQRCEIGMLPLGFFQQLMRGNDAFCRHFAMAVWQRWTQLQQHVLASSGSRIERVAAAIVMHWSDPQDGGEGHPANDRWVRVNQASLARYCGLSRQRTNSCLRDMELQGLLERGGRRIRIVDLQRMQSLAHGIAGQ